MLRVAQPARARPLLAAIASGTLESATATRKTALTLPLTTIVSPSTSDSGIPSNTPIERSAKQRAASREPLQRLTTRGLGDLPAADWARELIEALA
jgi:hypothetical protein